MHYFPSTLRVRFDSLFQSEIGREKYALLLGRSLLSIFSAAYTFQTMEQPERSKHLLRTGQAELVIELYLLLALFANLRRTRPDACHAFGPSAHSTYQ